MISKVSPSDFGASALQSPGEGAHYYRAIPPKFSGNGAPFFVNNAPESAEHLLLQVPIARFLAEAKVAPSTLQQMAISNEPFERLAVERVLGGPLGMTFIPRVAATDEDRLASVVEVMRKTVPLARALAAAGAETMPVEEMPYGHVRFNQATAAGKKPTVFALKEIGAKSLRGDTAYDHYFIASLIENFTRDRPFMNLLRSYTFGSEDDGARVTIKSFLPMRMAEAYVWLVDRQFRAYATRF